MQEEKQKGARTIYAGFYDYLARLKVEQPDKYQALRDKFNEKMTAKKPDNK